MSHNVGDEPDAPNELRDSVMRKLRHDRANRQCIDCNQMNPNWASATFGVFVCLECSAFHRKMGAHISFVRSVDMDYWKYTHLLTMKVSQNGKLRQFFKQHGVPDGAKGETKYNTRAAQLYKQKLNHEVAEVIRRHGGNVMDCFKDDASPTVQAQAAPEVAMDPLEQLVNSFTSVAPPSRTTSTGSASGSVSTPTGAAGRPSFPTPTRTNSNSPSPVPAAATGGGGDDGWTSAPTAPTAAAPPAGAAAPSVVKPPALTATKPAPKKYTSIANKKKLGGGLGAKKLGGGLGGGLGAQRVTAHDFEQAAEDAAKAPPPKPVSSMPSSTPQATAATSTPGVTAVPEPAPAAQSSLLRMAYQEVCEPNSSDIQAKVDADSKQQNNEFFGRTWGDNGLSSGAPPLNSGGQSGLSKQMNAAGYTSGGASTAPSASNAPAASTDDRFKGKKSISSAAFFDDGQQNEAQASQRLQQFQGAGAISSDQYFDRDAPPPGASPSDLAWKLANQAKQDARVLKDLASTSAQKVSGMATKLVSDWQSRYR
eukprot:GFYU01004576.1.p1 GENE.GFYU01004576.1~~GFYU01004576.1.p1  ORF type:complete len:537 (+),score=138.72 GFYU01004576.1:35-1645(+)